MTTAEFLRFHEFKWEKKKSKKKKMNKHQQQKKSQGYQHEQQPWFQEFNDNISVAIQYFEQKVTPYALSNNPLAKQFHRGVVGVMVATATYKADTVHSLLKAIDHHTTVSSQTSESSDTAKARRGRTRGRVMVVVGDVVIDAEHKNELFAGYVVIDSVVVIVLLFLYHFFHFIINISMTMSTETDLESML